MPMPGMPKPPPTQPVVVQPTAPPPPPPTYPPSPPPTYPTPPPTTQPPFIQCYPTEDCVPAHVCSHRQQLFDDRPTAVRLSIFQNDFLKSDSIALIIYHFVIEMSKCVRRSSRSMLSASPSTNSSANYSANSSANYSANYSATTSTDSTRSYPPRFLFTTATTSSTSCRSFRLLSTSSSSSSASRNSTSTRNPTTSTSTSTASRGTILYPSATTATGRSSHRSSMRSLQANWPTAVGQR